MDYLSFFSRKNQGPLPSIYIELLFCNFNTVFQYVFLLACGKLVAAAVHSDHVT